MPQYLLSIIQPDGLSKTGTPPPPEVLQKIMRDVGAVQAEMRAAGVWVFAGGLHPPASATLVRWQNGEVLMTDGPYVESKEHIGGFTIIEAPGLDAALGWGGKLARAVTLPVEVRPFRDQHG